MVSFAETMRGISFPRWPSAPSPKENRSIRPSLFAARARQKRMCSSPTIALVLAQRRRLCALEIRPASVDLMRVTECQIYLEAAGVRQPSGSSLEKLPCGGERLSADAETSYSSYPSSVSAAARWHLFLPPPTKARRGYL